MSLDAQKELAAIEAELRRRSGGNEQQELVEVDAEIARRSQESGAVSPEQNQLGFNSPINNNNLMGSMMGLPQSQDDDAGFFEALGRRLLSGILSPQVLASSNSGLAMAGQLGMNVLDTPASIGRAAAPDAEAIEGETFNSALARGRGFDETALGDKNREMAENIIPEKSNNAVAATLNTVLPDAVAPDDPQAALAGGLNFAAELLLDPANLIGAGFLSKVNKLRKAGKSAEAVAETKKAVTAVAEITAQPVEQVETIAEKIIRQLDEADAAKAKPVEAADGQLISDAEAAGTIEAPDGDLFVDEQTILSQKPNQKVGSPQQNAQPADLETVSIEKTGEIKQKKQIVKQDNQFQGVIEETPLTKTVNIAEESQSTQRPSGVVPDSKTDVIQSDNLAPVAPKPENRKQPLLNPKKNEPDNILKDVDTEKVGKSKLKQYREPIQELVTILRKTEEDAIQKQRRGTRPISEIMIAAEKLEPEVTQKMLKGLKPGTVFNAEEAAAMARVVFRQAPKIVEDVINGIPNKVAVGAEGVKTEIGRGLRILQEQPNFSPEEIIQVRKLVESIGDKPVKARLKVSNKKSFLNVEETARMQEIKNRLRGKLNNLNAGLDPEIYKLYSEVGAIYIKAGARNFAEFSAAMIDELGEAVKPHLKSLYEDTRKIFANSKIANDFDDPDIVELMQGYVQNVADDPKIAREQAVKLFGNVGLDKREIDPTAIDKFVEYATAIKLTGLSTHIRGAIGNAGEVILRVPEKFLGASAAKVKQAFTGVEASVKHQEALAELMGMQASLSRATKRAWEILKDPNLSALEATKAGDASIRKAGAIGKGGIVGEMIDTKLLKLTKGHVGFDLGEIVRAPFRAIGAMDVFFKEIHKGAEIYAQVARSAVKNGKYGADLIKEVAEAAIKAPDEFAELHRLAEQDALKRVFQEELEGFAKTIGAFRNKHTLSKLVFPFYNTPVNLFKRALRRTPTGTFFIPSDWNKFGYASRFRKNWTPKEGVYVGTNSPEFYEMIGQQLVGSAFFGAAMTYALAGGISGRGDKSKARRDTMRAVGWQPYSIKVGDTWVSYRGFEPISSWLRTGADIGEGRKQGEVTAAVAKKSMHSFMQQFAENPFLTGVSDIVEALNNPEGYAADSFIANLAVGSTVPVILQQWATRVYDPVVRNSRGLGNRIKSRLPGVSKALLPLRDVFGREITREYNAIPQALGFTLSVTDKSPLAKELERLQIEEPGKDGETKVRKISISKPQRKIRGYELTDEEYDRYLMLSGMMIHETLKSLIASPAYKKADDEMRFRAIRSTVSDVRKIVRHEEFAKYYR